MLVTLCKLLCASNSARVSPCWYLHARDSVQATLRKLTKSSWYYLHAGDSVQATLRKLTKSSWYYLHAGDSVQATLRKLTKSSARKNPSQCFRERNKNGKHPTYIRALFLCLQPQEVHLEYPLTNTDWYLEPSQMGRFRIASADVLVALAAKRTPHSMDKVYFAPLSRLSTSTSVWRGFVHPQVLRMVRHVQLKDLGL